MVASNTVAWMRALRPPGRRRGPGVAGVVLAVIEPGRRVFIRPVYLVWRANARNSCITQETMIYLMQSFLALSER